MSEEPTTNGNGAEPKLITLEQHKESLRALSSSLVDRALLRNAMGMTHGGKRDTWSVFGYDDVVTTAMYRERYERGGIAKSAIDVMPLAVWRGDGDVFENENPDKTTEFEKQWDELNDQLRVWSTLQRAHVLASLNRFSGILIGAPGDPSTPLPKGAPGSVLYLRPIGGSVDQTERRASVNGVRTAPDASIAVKDYDEDTKSRRFGLPLRYTLLGSAFSESVRSKPVHWTRIVHVPARGFLDGELFGPPGLEAIWNYLLDLDKVEGGGSEAYWLRANAGLHLNVDTKMALASTATPTEREAELTKLREDAEAYVHQMSRMMRTRGVDVNQLGSDVADFSQPQDAILTLIAGTLRIPKRILTGSEMGKMASEQDRDNWNDVVSDCRTDYAQPVVLRPFVQRLIDFGYLATPKEWDVEWPDEGAMTLPEKMTSASQMADINQKMGETVYTQNEIREFTDYEPFTEDELAEMAEAKAEEAAVAFERSQEAAQVEGITDAIKSGANITIAVKR